MITDLTFSFYWWLLLFSLGVLSLPLTWYFFKKFFDVGYPFSKVLGILLISYSVWLAGSLKILPFTSLTIWFFILLLGAGNFLILKKHKEEFLEKLQEVKRVIIFEEVVFFLALTVWGFIRGFEPRIEGLEKFMDFGFINSILRSRFFPPADMWMAGETINYYYFGHFVAALLTKLSQISSIVTYNLMIATSFAFCFTLGFSLSSNFVHFFYLAKAKANFKKILAAGFLSAALLSLGSNLHPAYWFIKNRSFETYWYPDATRFIVEKFGALDNTIHEFPIYSFVVSDLHGHVSNIPFVLLFLALSISFLISISEKKNFHLYANHYIPLLALILAAMYMTNSWDFPIYFILLGLILFGFFFYQKKKIFQAFTQTLGPTLVIFLLAIFFCLPFNLHFSPMAEGIGLVHARSPFWQLLVLWGYPWAFTLLFLIFLFRQKKLKSLDIFFLAVLFWATILIVIPEFLYVKDIYIVSYHRANTMFKLVYQSFMMYALCVGYIIIRISTAIKHRGVKILFSFLCLALLLSPLIYPYFAVRSYYGNLKIYRGLEGLGFLKNSSPDDYQAVLWLNENISGQPVVLEAVGDSYTQYNRVSALTGLPTVEGWLVHEWLWRGGFDEPGKRASEVKTIYETQDINPAKSLLEKYQVKYVFLGTKEQERYQVTESKFKNLGEVIFSQGSTRIYRLFPKDSQ